jgi:hypothetical protein
MRIASLALTTLLVAATSACGGSDAKPSASAASTADLPAATAAPAVSSPVDTIGTEAPATSVDSAPTPPSAAPADGAIADPCDLLTPAAAGVALGVAVGEALTQPGEGNVTCGYRPADPSAQGFVSLTTYSAVGTEAVLDQAAAQNFPDSKPVDGVGDAARVSLQGQAIGVLFGHTVFALGLFPQAADGQLLPVTEDQLIAAARAVLDGQ